MAAAHAASPSTESEPRSAAPASAAALNAEVINFT